MIGRGAGLSRVEGLPIIGVFVLLIGLFIVLAPNVFLGYRIYMSFLATVPPVLVLALGLTMVIAAGEIDLSFPSVIAFSGFIFAFLFKHYELTWLALAGALLGGALIGVVNGVLVAGVGIPSIIATLATQFFWGELLREVNEDAEAEELADKARTIRRKAAERLPKEPLYDRESLSL